MPSTRYALSVTWAGISYNCLQPVDMDKTQRRDAVLVWEPRCEGTSWSNHRGHSRTPGRGCLQYEGHTTCTLIRFDIYQLDGMTDICACRDSELQHDQRWIREN